MNNDRTADSATLAISTVAAVAMIATTAALLPPELPQGQLGICLPSPNLWPWFSLEPLVNAILIGGAILAGVLLNKKYGFIRSADTAFPSLMAVTIASNPLMTSYLGTPALMLICNIICLAIMMGAYRSRNATHQMFAVATFISLGSMVQYAFIPLVAVYPLMAIMIKVARWREMLAYGMGLVAPYWIWCAFGLFTWSPFTMPQFQFALPDIGSNDDIFLMLLSLGALALIAFISSLNNVMLLFAGNSRVRTFNNMINALGLASFICMIFDFSNVAAYATTLCFTSSAQIANFFAIHQIPRSRIWLYTLLALFILFFILIVAI